MVALNWHHPSWLYSPALNAVRYPNPLNLPVPAFPDGDYYAHTEPDLRWGTFGHPWQESLCRPEVIRWPRTPRPCPAVLQ